MGRVAVLTRSGKVGLAVFRIRFAIVEIEDLKPGDGAQLIAFIFPERDIVLLLAGHSAGHAAGALVQIDRHAVAKST